MPPNRRNTFANHTKQETTETDVIHVYDSACHPAPTPGAVRRDVDPATCSRSNTRATIYHIVSPTSASLITLSNSETVTTSDRDDCSLVATEPTVYLQNDMWVASAVFDVTGDYGDRMKEPRLPVFSTSTDGFKPAAYLTTGCVMGGGVGYIRLAGGGGAAFRAATHPEEAAMSSPALNVVILILPALLALAPHSSVASTSHLVSTVYYTLYDDSRRMNNGP
ncbi:hypothetical protein AAG570_003838 [Ranatra chinensis]|uniref:Uncharacterized protein n=1 Tax=Ranatra chinensis TaxID=642074 RepID=A0ABD0Y2T4_9HEMI